MTFKPEIGKRHVTRGGEITAVLKQDAHCGMLYTGDKFEPPSAWYSTGTFFTDIPSINDLVAVYEEPKYYWLNVYPDGTCRIHEIESIALSVCEKHNGGKTLKLKVVKDDE